MIVAAGQPPARPPASPALHNTTHLHLQRLAQAGHPSLGGAQEVGGVAGAAGGGGEGRRGRGARFGACRQAGERAGMRRCLRQPRQGMFPCCNGGGPAQGKQPQQRMCSRSRSPAAHGQPRRQRRARRQQRARLPREAKAVKAGLLLLGGCRGGLAPKLALQVQSLGGWGRRPGRGA